MRLCIFDNTRRNIVNADHVRTVYVCLTFVSSCFQRMSRLPNGRCSYGKDSFNGVRLTFNYRFVYGS